MPATHDTARAICPDARVAYVDHDELVIAHARALLAIDGNIAVIPADLRDAGAVLTDPALLQVIDLEQPVCVRLVSVLHFLRPRPADLAVAAYRQAIAPGSHLVISAGTSTGTCPELIRTLHAVYRHTAPVTGRSQSDITAWFTGLTLTPPGLADVRDWQPDTRGPAGQVRPSRGGSWPESPSSPPPRRRTGHDRRQPRTARRGAGHLRAGRRACTGRRAAAAPAPRMGHYLGGPRCATTQPRRCSAHRAEPI
jgi:hypothetical protein